MRQDTHDRLVAEFTRAEQATAAAAPATAPDPTPSAAAEQASHDAYVAHLAEGIAEAEALRRAGRPVPGEDAAHALIAQGGTVTPPRDPNGPRLPAVTAGQGASATTTTTQTMRRAAEHADPSPRAAIARELRRTSTGGHA